jgi:hypothetical protein
MRHAGEELGSRPRVALVDCKLSWLIRLAVIMLEAVKAERVSSPWMSASQ